MASKKTKCSTDERIRIVLQTFNPETKVAELCREHNLAPRTLPCVTGVCARRCHVLAMRLVQSSCRLAGRFFKYSGPSRSGTCPVSNGIAGRRAARTGCPLHGSRDCPAGPRREGRQKSGKIRCVGSCGCPPGGRAWRYVCDSAMRLVLCIFRLTSSLSIPLYSVPLLSISQTHSSMTLAVATLAFMVPMRAASF